MERGGKKIEHREAVQNQKRGFMKKFVLRSIAVLGIIFFAAITLLFLIGKNDTVNEIVISSLFGTTKYNEEKSDLPSELALSEIAKGAERGDPVMQYNLAIKYQEGDGIEKSQEKASYWYLKAAGQGLPQAQTKIGARYWQGLGVGMDRVAAVHWFEMAARQDEPSAELALSSAYTIGFGTNKPNYEKAFYWMQKAAEHGVVQAQFETADMYAKGRGVTKNEQRALYWYRRAADSGSYPAMRSLSEIYAMGLLGVSVNKEEANMWLERARAVKR